jgi:signal transduction histidine kinase
MTETITCPRCRAENQADTTYCTACNINLPLAVLFRKSSGLTDSTSIPRVTISPEVLVPRLGESLIEKGVLTEESLDEALEYKRQQTEAGSPMLVGQALLALDMVSQEALDEVVTEQILQLQAALQQANDQLGERVQERTLELQKALDQLTELNRLKSNFVSNISHELRTPLAHVLGYTELMHDGSLGPLNEEQTKGLEVVMRATRRLERLIEDLIQFSIAGQEQYAIRLEPTAAAALLGLVCSQNAAKAATKSIAIVKQWDTDLPFVLADGEKITWVVSQLVDNAIKFTPKGGKVFVGAEQDDHKMRFWVRDTGIGLPPNRVDEIFEPFHQLDSSTTRRHGGTGLGLALVRRIIEAHQTTIDVQSVEEKGTGFEFKLPVYVQPEGGSGG